jgi:uncharacterized protein YdhG (YjbR/CyaY superfamily)
MATAEKSAKKKTAPKFTADERAAMRERARELKSGDADGEAQVLAKIAEMSEPDRTIARRLHDLVKATAPMLKARTWYGMPAYAKDGKVLCYFQSAGKFKARYSHIGFTDSCNLDDGTVWPIAYALTAMTAAEETKVGALLKQAIS